MHQIGHEFCKTRAMVELTGIVQRKYYKARVNTYSSLRAVSIRAQRLIYAADSIRLTSTETVRLEVPPP